MRRELTLLTAAAIAAALGLGGASVAPDANRGRDLFERRCTGCHALDRPKAGPPLRAVFARPAGRDTQFPYSDAMKQARAVWDEPTLDKWLTDPDSVVPGNDMSFRLDNPGQRADIIAYLKQLGGR